MSSASGTSDIDLHSIERQVDGLFCNPVWIMIRTQLDMLYTPMSCSSDNVDSADEFIRDQIAQQTRDLLQRYIQINGRQMFDPSAHVRISRELNNKLLPLLNEPDPDRRAIAVEAAEFDADFRHALDFGIAEVFRIIDDSEDQISKLLKASRPAVRPIVYILCGAKTLPGLNRAIVDDVRWVLRESPPCPSFQTALETPEFPVNLLRVAAFHAGELVKRRRGRTTEALVELTRGLAGIYSGVTRNNPTLGSGDTSRSCSRFEAFALPIVKIVRRQTTIASFREVLQEILQASRARLHK